MNPFSLYDLGREYNDTMREIEDADGILTPELEERIDAITAGLARSVDNVARALAMIKAGNTELDAWLDKIARRKAALEREEERWKKAAMGNMIGMNVNELEGETAKLRIMESKSIKINDAEKIPAELQRVIPERREPDKMAIKKAIASGEDVPGAEMVTSQYLRVY